MTNVAPPVPPAERQFFADHPVMCQWFARCPYEATGYVFHPILGPVPTCDRCERFAS